MGTRRRGAVAAVTAVGSDGGGGGDEAEGSGDGSGREEEEKAEEVVYGDDCGGGEQRRRMRRRRRACFVLQGGARAAAAALASRRAMLDKDSVKTATSAKTTSKTTEGYCLFVCTGFNSWKLEDMNHTRGFASSRSGCRASISGGPVYPLRSLRLRRSPSRYQGRGRGARRRRPAASWTRSFVFICPSKMFGDPVHWLFFSYFKELVGKEVTVELKNDLAIRGTLHSVDQYLNIKLENTRVVDQDKYPHMLSVRNCFIRGSVVRYVLLPQDGVDIDILHDATRREARGG
uniref:SnRNP core protein SMX5d n=1 Tax=Oryza sativa subsp. japonica TaxID=39947 RepID=Q7F193_ORYSJ|nr:putative snRNP core protein SMX5d [Oryza sativa Japonica Group]